MQVSGNVSNDSENCIDNNAYSQPEIIIVKYYHVQPLQHGTWSSIIMYTHHNMAPGPVFSFITITVGHLVHIGLIQVKEEGWTGFSEGWQG